MLHPPTPPYALTPVEFAFPALAALSGRLPIGAGRESILATLLTARLAAGVLPGGPSAAGREPRATAAAQWLRAMCPDAKVRAACTAVAEASARSQDAPVAAALQAVIAVTAPYLDTASGSELAALVAALKRAAAGPR